MMYCIFCVVQPGNVACTAKELQALDDPGPFYGRTDDHLVTPCFLLSRNNSNLVYLTLLTTTGVDRWGTGGRVPPPHFSGWGTA